MCCRIRVFLIIIIIFLSLQKLGPPNYSYGPWWTKTLIYIYIYIYIFWLLGVVEPPLWLLGVAEPPP